MTTTKFPKSGRGIASTATAVALLLLVSPRKAETNRLSSHRLIPVVSTIILIAIMASMTQLCLAAVYECRDAEGKSVLTNRQRGLHSCRSIIEEAASVPPSPESKETPQQQPSVMTIPNESLDDREPTLPSFPPNVGPDSAPPPHSSCRQGVNLLNPFIATPCPHPDPSPQSQPRPDGEPSLGR